LEFTVNKSVLVPRPDTETLVETAIEILSASNRVNPLTVLDLCTGSGAVAISLKNEMPELEVYAADICPNALEVAKENSKKLLGKNQIQFFLGDLFDALRPTPDHSGVVRQEKSFSNNFSIIVSNPPYIQTNEIKTLSAEVQNEPRLALDGGKTGLDIIERIIKEATDFLQNPGFLVLEADPRQMNDIKTILDKNGFIDIQLFKDLSGQERVISGKWK